MIAAASLVRYNARLDLSGQTAIGLVHSQLEESGKNLTMTRDRMELIKLLRLAGSMCYRITTNLHETLVQHASSQIHQDVVQRIVDLEKTLSDPLTLKELARVAIRGKLDSELLHKKHLLPIPVLLQDYLLILEEEKR